jgi:multidrug efflux pump
MRPGRDGYARRLMRSLYSLPGFGLSRERARNLANNALANTRHGPTSTGAAVSTSPETMVPLSAFAHFSTGNTPLSVNHEGLSVAATISFNLAPGASLSRATAAIEDRMRRA